MRWKAAILGLALCACGGAQNERPGVAGRVTNTAGKPLGHATIALVGNGRTPAAPVPPVFRTTSDADGAFVIEDVEPNTYRIFVQRTGYLEYVYHEPDGRVAVEIGRGERKKIDVRMTAPSYLSGRVTDPDGEPFPDARVNVFRVSTLAGKKRLTALSAVAAGPDGNFSIGRLTAGRYYLAAANPPSLTATSLREMHAKTGDERYVTTYYPSAIDTAAATLIELRAETELRGMDIRVRRARVFHIAGKVVAQGGPAPNPSIALIRPDVTDMSDPLGNANRILPIDGAFQINGLLPGTYAFQAWAGASRQMQGHRTVVLADRDLDDVVLPLAPALEIPLTVKIEDADPEQARSIAKSLGRFTLTASDGVNLNAMAQEKEDGTWIFHNIGSGTYWMGLGGPEGTYVKSIRFGEQDVTRSQLDTTSGGGALAMTLSPHGAEVSGTVNDADGKALAGVTVTLWIAGMPPAGTIDQARSTVTDAAGNFRFEGVRPGEYRVAAWEAIEPGLANVTEFHMKFDGDATVVRVSEDAREKVKAALIGREKVEAAAALVQ